MALEASGLIAKRLGGVVSKRSGLALGVWGEPGVGKTFTVQSALREIPCRSVTVHSAVSNVALARALTPPKQLPVWASRTIGSLERGEHIEANRVADALAACLAALAPFVLSIEDLHEAASDRGEHWRHLAATVNRTRGAALIVTGRTAPPEPFESIHLELMSGQDARSLLEAEAGSGLPSDAIAWIESHACGNPLFTLEYFRHLTRLGYLWSDGRRWRWRTPEADATPTSVEAVIGHHLHAVVKSGATRRALAVKAMLPLETGDLLWAEVAALEMDELRAARETLERGGVLRGATFAHPLYREAMRSAISGGERREIARRAINLLSERDPVAAASFVADADLSVDEARTLLDRAAQTARKLGDTEQAARFLIQVAAYVVPAARVETMLEAARLSREVNLALALEMAQAALALEADHLEAVLLTTELLAGIGRGEEAERLLDRFLNLRGLITAEEALRALESRIRVKHLSHDYAGVLELWREHEAREPSARPRISMSVIARALVQLWRLEEAEVIISQALEAPKVSRLELAELHYIRSIIPNYAGDYAGAEVGFSAFLRTLDALEDGSQRFRDLRAGTLQLRAYMRNVLGRPREAVEDITAALALSAGFGNAGYYAHVQSELGLYLLENGEYRRAEDVILEARATLEQVGNPIYLSVLERIAARLYLEWAPPHGAALSLKCARAALDHVDQAERPPFYTAGALFIAAWAEALHGSQETALGLVAELDASASALGQIGVTAGAAWVRGLALEKLGQHDQAERALRAALQARIPMRLGPSLDRMAFELDRLTGNIDAALERADTVRAHGALGPLHVAHRYFPQLDRRTAPRATPKTAATVRLEVLGPTRVIVNGSTLSDRTRKGKELLAALCEARVAGRREVSDLDLLDALYPDLPEDKAGSALKQLVYRLRAVLGLNTILRSNDGYALGSVETDAELFLETKETRLWRGPYQVDLGDQWGAGVRDALHYALRKRSLELLERDPKETARLGRILLEADPFNLEAFEITLRGLRASGDGSGVTRLHMWARARFEEVGEYLPSEFERAVASYLS